MCMDQEQVRVRLPELLRDAGCRRPRSLKPRGSTQPMMGSGGAPWVSEGQFRPRPRIMSPSWPLDESVQPQIQRRSPIRERRRDQTGN